MSELRSLRGLSELLRRLRGLSKLSRLRGLPERTGFLRLLCGFSEWRRLSVGWRLSKLLARLSKGRGLRRVAVATLPLQLLLLPGGFLELRGHTVGSVIRSCARPALGLCLWLWRLHAAHRTGGFRITRLPGLRLTLHLRRHLGQPLCPLILDIELGWSR